jgi:hypothetical protein
MPVQVLGQVQWTVIDIVTTTGTAETLDYTTTIQATTQRKLGCLWFDYGWFNRRTNEIFTVDGTVTSGTQQIQIQVEQ